MANFTFQEDTFDEFRWSTIETEFSDSGTVLNRYTVFDDTTTRRDAFSDGKLRYQILEDLDETGGPSDVKPWESVRNIFDDTGQRVDSFTRYDNGTGLRKQFENGQVRQITQTDFGPDGMSSATKSWERIETRFDENGNRDHRFELYDNGVRVEKFYDNGVIRREERLDLNKNGDASDARIWEAILIEYDGDGKISERFELRDNGLETLRYYEDGVVRFMEQLDSDALGNSTDTAAWDRIETVYDALGVIQARTEFRDDGTVLTRAYEDGKLVFAEHLDRDELGQMSSTKTWDVVRTFYDDAGLKWRESVMDNGDVTAIEFEAGRRLLKLEVDGDDSAAWVLRTTLYDAQGKVFEVNTYNSLDEVPAEYRWFDVVAG